MIDEVGPSSLSLRELARRAGVSHGAPAHHFGDRRGLLTALAAQGLRLLAADVAAATAGGFDEAAVAYVRFAREHPGHYAVMHRPELLHADDGELSAARASSKEALMAGVESIPAERRAHLTTSEAAHVAWSLVHGLASLAARRRYPRSSNRRSRPPRRSATLRVSLRSTSPVSTSRAKDHGHGTHRNAGLD
ncbi:TetR/AcrR family transcriptional regulator [Corynebacterium suedekumii]|nr:TetR/AcrR family transcriptional regulator [Corynebacterium suedekumii]